jgi:hypothetical protein
MREMRNAYKYLIGKSEWKRLLGRPRRRWENLCAKVLKSRMKADTAHAPRLCRTVLRGNCSKTAAYKSKNENALMWNLGKRVVRIAGGWK